MTVEHVHTIAPEAIQLAWAFLVLGWCHLVLRVALLPFSRGR